MSLKCKIWAHRWDANVSCLLICERCEYIYETGENNQSLNLEDYFERLRWHLFWFFNERFQFEYCPLCKKYSIRVFGKQISNCKDDCLPF